MDDDLGDLRDPTDVDAAPAAEPDITRNYDGGEWLAGFNQGVVAGRRDVIQALQAVMGVSQVSRDIELRVLEMLIDPAR